MDHGWKDEWIKAPYEFNKLRRKQKPKKEDTEPQSQFDIKLAAWEKYQTFVEKWRKFQSNLKVPKWYKFDPEHINATWGNQSGKDKIWKYGSIGEEFHNSLEHNSLRSMDETMFNFLKDKPWNQRIDAEETEDKKNKYEEKPYFVVDCGQLLGIGGEAVVIRKDVADKVVTKETDKQADREFEALKIIPMMKHNFESEERLEEMKKRVDDRQEKADIEKELEKQKNRLQQRKNQQRN